MRVGDIRTPLRSPTPLDPGALDHYWHPDREGVERCPADFQRELALVHHDLAIVRPPAGAPLPHPRKWLVWYRKTSITHRLCPGWLLLFIWPPEPYEPIPLDNRVLANLYMVDARRFGNGAQYFDRIVAQMESEKEHQQAQEKAFRDDRIKDYWESTKIKNIGHGSKFALHHDGTVVPSQGERAWTAERADRMLPESVARDRRRK